MLAWGQMRAEPAPSRGCHYSSARRIRQMRRSTVVVVAAAPVARDGDEGKVGGRLTEFAASSDEGARDGVAALALPAS